ncbi:ABC transporter permease [Campylobacter coli]|nr:ABC transporter permease [Campylobacter coli]
MKEKFLAFLSILPFFIVFTFFMIAPLIWIVFNAFYVEEDEIYSLANFIHIFESKFYLQSIINSLQISFISSIFGLLIGLLASYSLFVLAPSKICKFLFSLNTMISNFSGVPLAFAFIIVLGSNGVVNVFLKNLGIEPFVSVYANFGVNIVYVYFQIPLAILLLLPAFKSLENSHLNACKMLGGGNFLYWLKIALPLLAPVLFGVFVILFANAFGAYATIYALSSGNFNVTPVRIAALIAGDINLDPYMASALSIIITIIMLVVTFIANFLSKKYNFKVL